MSIPAKFIVSVTPKTISVGATDLETNGMVLTKSVLIPTDKPALTFTSATAVADFFGAESDEAKFAQQYFTGLTNQQKAPTSLVIGRRIGEDASAWIRGGVVSADLTAFKAVSDGSLKITIDGTEKTAANVNLTEATSLSDVAEKIATAVTGCTGSYDSNTNTFTFTSATKGTDSTVSYGSAGEGGTDLSTMLCLTQAAGAVLSQGVAAMTETTNLNAICSVMANWTQFTTLWEVTEQDEAEAYAAWADIDDDYVYVFWSSDQKMADQLTQDATIAAQLKDKYNCTMMLYASDYLSAAFVLAYPATIKWDTAQGMKVIFGKSASGLEPTITSESQATALDSLRVSYVGQFATRNDEFTFANRGSLASDYYGFIDVLIGSIWLRSKLQTSIMNGFASVNRVPYNNRGYTMVRAWCQDPINQGINCGAVDADISLSESQKAQILQETNDENAAGDIQSNGYFLQILDPGAAARAQRETPVMNLLYGYGGSIQRVALPVVTVL